MHEAHTKDATNAPPGALEAAVARAVAESLEVVSGLQARVDTALGALEAVAVRARVGIGGDESAAEAVELFWKELQTSRSDAADLFERQRKVLGSVNLALFGRTGAG